MIAPLCDKGQGTRACFVAKEFSVPHVTPDTKLRISAQGLYRCFINGERVGHDLLTPGWTNYDDRIAFQTYDVAKHLRTGENRIEIWLGDGWWRSQLLWKQNPIYNCYGEKIAAIAELASGNDLVLKTDATWRSGLLPITKSGIYYGEDYDARLEKLEASSGVEVLPFKSRLVPQETPPVSVIDIVGPIATWSDAEGRTIYDFGQNAAGFVRFTVEGEAGATIAIDNAEILGPNKQFDNRNYRSARSAVVYTLKGGGHEAYEPHFTFMGFRFARAAIKGRAKILAIDFVRISSVPVAKGGFQCGEQAVTQLVSNTMWSQRANFIEIPTDCPQRDERLGWTGDANVFAGTACWLADSQSFLRKYLRDVVVDQRSNGAISHFSPDPTRLHPMGDPANPAELARAGDWAGSTGWGDAIVTIPWQLYLHYGDKDVLRECFPAMLKWLGFVWAISNGPIVRPPSRWGAKGFTFGDWIQPVGDNRKPRPTISDECAATLYHGISTQLAAKVAAAIGKKKEAAQLKKRFAQIQKAFAHEFFSPSGRLAHNDQTSYALAFLYDMVPAKYFNAAKSYFRQIIIDADHVIGTGFIGTPALLPALCKIGLEDLAEKLLLNRKVPGWLYQVERGATTIWERWDAQAPDGTIYDPDMNSYNHYAYGSVCQWLFESVAGVAPSETRPGFDEVIINPQFLPELSPVSMWHECRHGRITVKWSRAGGKAQYVIELPQNCSGRLMPNPKLRVVTINGKRPSALALPPGKHQIEFQLITSKGRTKK